MISTITTTVTTVATLAVSATMGVLVTLLLISLLSTKEIVATDKRQFLQLFGRNLNISIFPLFTVFSLIVSIKIFAFL